MVGYASSALSWRRPETGDSNPPETSNRSSKYKQNPYKTSTKACKIRHLQKHYNYNLNKTNTISEPDNHNSLHKKHAKCAHQNLQLIELDLPSELQTLISVCPALIEHMIIIGTIDSVTTGINA